MKPRDSEQARCEALIERYAGYAWAIVARVAGSYATREDIEECTADVLLAAWQARHRFDPDRGDFTPYLAAIARNKAVKLRQRLSKTGAFLPLEEDLLALDVPEPAAQYEQGELQTLLEQGIQSLEPPDPEIFERRYYWGEAMSDIARAMGLTERAVEGRLYRGRKRLKLFFEGRL